MLSYYSGYTVVILAAQFVSALERLYVEGFQLCKFQTSPGFTLI